MAVKQIHLNAFEMNCVGHLARGMWRHPADSRYRYTDLDYWNEEARLLEAGCFDALFLADVLGTYETVGRTLDEAERKAEDYAQFRTVQSRFFGLDLSHCDPATLLQDVRLPSNGAGRGPARFIGEFIQQWAGQPTVADLQATIRRHGWIDPFSVIGTPDEIADRIEEFIEVTDVDGFNVHSNVSLESYRDFVDLVIPVLQDRGLFRAGYDPTQSTLRERLFGTGSVRLPSTHPGAACRRATAHVSAAVTG